MNTVILLCSVSYQDQQLTMYISFTLSTIAVKPLRTLLLTRAPNILPSRSHHKHCEYQSFEEVHVYGLTQAFGPVHPIPPHCPQRTCVPVPVDGVVVPVVAAVVVAAVVVAVVVPPSALTMP